MFKFLKEKLKSAVSVFSKKVEQEAKPVELRETKPKGKPKKTTKKKTRQEKALTPEAIRTIPEERGHPVQEEPKPEPSPKSAPAEAESEQPKRTFWGLLKKTEPTTEKPKKGFFGAVAEAVTKTAISESKFEELFSELEIALLEANVAFVVVEKIKADLKHELVDQKVLRGSIEQTVNRTLRNSINELFLEPTDVLARIRASEKPFVIAFVGVNGSGKTTTIAKFAHLCLQNKLRPVIAAADTFRAAAIQQLEEHANRLSVKLIKQDYGADPAAVGFDAISYAKAHAMDVVLIDTAGRQHANANLMEEMKKIIRVCKPHMTIFIGESITGNDCVEQAREFGEAVSLDGIILTKADVDEKGGAFVSVSYVTKKPILYVGMGQGYDDLKPFNKETVMQNLGIA
ncbi:MAG TPA: signal recognition particle-docking protein FtsY [Candidatus Nanoarchaeia archaeon]|nr:signal recognition particle-docking protein FtsY [Candidatus Nanoarchaeia archaeon]